VRGPARHVSLTRFVSAGTVDLGNEPPLYLTEEPEKTPVARAVSFRWLGGTILTGFTSIFLMGGALMAALDNPNQFASLPEALGLEVGDLDGGDFGQKSDRMLPIEEEVATRQILQVSTVTRQGERDFIKLRPFAKITATLGSAKEEHAAEIPPYDVLRIFADTSASESDAPSPGGSTPDATDDQISDTTVDGEVAVKVSALPVDAPGLSNVSLDAATVEQVVRAAMKSGSGGDVKMATAMAYADEGEYGGDADMIEGEDDPFSALGVKIVPENVSSIAKSDLAAGADQTVHEKILAVTDDRDLHTILSDNYVEEDAADITAALSELIDVDDLDASNKIRIAYVVDETDGVTDRPVRVSVYDNGAHQATVARADSNGFVRADEPSSIPDEIAVAEVTPEPAGGAMPKVYDAVYQTALEQQIPAPLIDQLVRIFAFDVDFQGRTSPGDSMEVLHSLPDEGDRDATDPEVLFAALTIGGVSKRFYRFRTSDDGYVDYYDEEGKSAKKFLMRKPMSSGVLRSGFGARVHPILGYRRMHTGVDFAAPRGTPILAAGNGVVEKAGRTSGYGNLIVLKHTNGYETAYAHQSSFAKGIAPGVRVRQGQIIGYVGSTGLSTGPHLHFEIRVNKSAVDPLRVRLPRGRVLEGDLLASFENERNRIDTLLGDQQNPTKVAAVAPPQQ
jgi:murein DD-endopeptidase MepM/ murein hydrolase activator NlpD